MSVNCECLRSTDLQLYVACTSIEIKFHSVYYIRIFIESMLYSEISFPLFAECVPQMLLVFCR
jgi:hypothetical protein